MNEETKEDIVCEMRMGSTGDMPCAYIVGMPDTIEEFLCGGKVPKINIKRVTVEELADRFEAAFKREPVSNWAAIRNALIELCTYAAACIDVGAFDRAHMNELVVKGRAALAAPPRNCDVMSVESAKKLWFAKEIFPRLNGDLPLGKEVPFEEWFVSQQEQGEGDGK